MIAFGSVPFCSSLNTSIWFLCVPSAAAWHAATPLPGTTTAMAVFIASSLVSTQDAAAMTTRPVDPSTASTDHVAEAVAGTSSRSDDSRKRARGMREIVADQGCTVTVV